MSFFLNKKVPRALSQETRDLIQLLGQTKNKQIQSIIINKQIADLRQTLSTTFDPSLYPNIFVKLIFFVTLGYDTSFAHILPINLCQSHDLYLKKMAYLLAAMLVEPGSQLSLLMNNTILRDLQSDNQFSLLIGLTMLRYFLTTDFIPTILPHMVSLTKHHSAIVRKKAFLLCLNVYCESPQQLNIKPYIRECLADKDDMVAFTGISMLMRVLASAHEYKDLVGRLVEMQMGLIQHRYPPSFDYHRVPSPWYQVQILRIVEEMCHNDAASSALIYDCLEHTLRYCITSHAHFIKCVTQQCIKTICNVYHNRTLVDRAAVATAAFFDPPTPIMQYFGVCCLTHLARVSQTYLQKWQLVLLSCLDSPDITLAKKTVSLLVSVSHHHNAAYVLQKLMSLASTSTQDSQKRVLIKQAIQLIERFSQEREIFLRRMNEIFYRFQQFISNASVNNFLKVLIEIAQIEEDFSQMAVRAYVDIITNYRNRVLVKVSAWIIGSFGRSLSDPQLVRQSAQALLDCSDQYIDDCEITFVLASNLMKLSSKTTLTDQIKNYLSKLQRHADFFVYRTGEEYLRLYHYGEQGYSSNDPVFDAKMPAFASYHERHTAQKPQYLVSKPIALAQQTLEKDIKYTGTVTSINELDIKNNAFEFKKAGLIKKQTQPKKEIKKEFHFKGPQEKTTNLVELKKKQLAKSLFGKTHTLNGLRR